MPWNGNFSEDDWPMFRSSFLFSFHLCIIVLSCHSLPFYSSVSVLWFLFVCCFLFPLWKSTFTHSDLHELCATSTNHNLMRTSLDVYIYSLPSFSLRVYFLFILIWILNKQKQHSAWKAFCLFPDLDDIAEIFSYQERASLWRNVRRFLHESSDRTRGIDGVIRWSSERDLHLQRNDRFLVASRRRIGLQECLHWRGEMFSKWFIDRGHCSDRLLIWVTRTRYIAHSAQKNNALTHSSDRLKSFSDWGERSRGCRRRLISDPIGSIQTSGASINVSQLFRRCNRISGVLIEASSSWDQEQRHEKWRRSKAEANLAGLPIDRCFPTNVEQMLSLGKRNVWLPRSSKSREAFYSS